MRYTRAPQHKPYALPRPNLTPRRQPSTRPSRESRRATGRHTDRRPDTRTHPREGRQPASASSSARAIAPVRGRGQRKGRAAGCRERQRQKEMKVPRQTGRQREGATDRQTRSRARAHTHTHTHTRTQRQRASDRETANGRQTGERGWHRIRDRHTGTDRDAPQREAARKQQLPQGRGRQPWAGPGWTAESGALGLAFARGDPKTSSSPRSHSAWLPKAGPSPCP